jgi:hypothetical protein
MGIITKIVCLREGFGGRQRKVQQFENIVKFVDNGRNLVKWTCKYKKLEECSYTWKLFCL